ncbi:MAG: N-acetylmuramoyl-L-alanine amidase [Maricaulaceae bacterium]|jgi:N-acetylmuramoyl-L-alanine amidase
MTDAPLTYIDAPSPNFDERGRSPDLIVLHYTGMANGEAALAKLCDPNPKMGDYAAAVPERFRGEDPNAEMGRASAHYLVEEDGRIFRLVAEDKRAWHAGQAFWDGASDVNARAIGIEIVNGGHDFGLPPYPDAQVGAVVALVKDICARRSIPPERVVGHSDVAPDRKEDPGEHFPWTALVDAELAVGLLASIEGRGERIAAAGDAGRAVKAVQEHLIAIGYGLAASGAMDERTVAVITAFQRRYRPALVDGVLDHETAELIEAGAERRAGG